MGRYGVVDVGGIWVAAWYETYDPQVAALFLDSDGLLEPGESHAECYTTTAREMRERLTLLGIKPNPTKDEDIERIWLSDLALSEFPVVPLERAIREWTDGVERHPMAPFMSNAEEFIQHNLRYERFRLFDLLRYLIDRVPDSFPVSMSLDRVLGIHGQVPSSTLCADARTEVLEQTNSTHATIVLTEGSTDAFVLQSALEFLRPHLSGFMTILDYSNKPEGGVDSVVKGLRAFAAAGVANRVIGLLDNDLAGREAMTQVAASKLPHRMKAVQLPLLPLATSYPANGTEGIKPKDINGTAVTIELFLGEDVLRGEDGALTPIQSTSWNQKYGEFHGSLVGKHEVQQRFSKKVKRARGGEFTSADWRDLDLLIQHIIDSV